MVAVETPGAGGVAELAGSGAAGLTRSSKYANPNGWPGIAGGMEALPLRAAPMA